MGVARDHYRKERAAINERAQNREEDAKSKQSWGNIINSSKLPEGVKFFKVKEGPHTIDILPFPAGITHPKAEEGQTIWVLDLFVHQNVGVEEQSYVCPQATWGLPCPVCQYQKAKGIREMLGKILLRELKKGVCF